MNILFLGDSITDCDHCFSSDNLGNGYVKIIAEMYKSSHGSSDLHIVNGGTDGFTFPRILQKWNQQYASQSWDVVCILAGVNEVGALMELPDSDKFNRDLYIQRSTSAFIELLSSMYFHGVKRILLLKPFLFEQPAYLLSWKPVLKEIHCMIDEICQYFINLPSLAFSSYSLQDYWDQLTLTISPEILSFDGIHLSDFGHQKLGKYVFELIFGTISE